MTDATRRNDTEKMPKMTSTMPKMAQLSKMALMPNRLVPKLKNGTNAEKMAPIPKKWHQCRKNGTNAEKMAPMPKNGTNAEKWYQSRKMAPMLKSTNNSKQTKNQTNKRRYVISSIAEIWQLYRNNDIHAAE